MPLDFTSGVDALYYGGPAQWFAHAPAVVEPDPQFFLPINPTFDGNTGTVFTTSQHRTFDVSWKVGVTRKEYANPITVCKAPGLPRPYHPYISADGLRVDPCAFAVEISAAPLDPGDWQWWLVIAKYGTDAPEEGMDFYTQWPSSLLGPQNNPWEMRPTLKIEYEEVQVAEPFDLAGQAYSSSAGQPLSPPPTKPVTYMTYVFEKNIHPMRVTPDLVTRYNNCLNEGEFLGQPNGCVKCTFRPSELRYKGKVPFYRASIRFQLETRWVRDPNTMGPGNPAGTPVRKTWQPWVLDQGTTQLVKLFGHPLKGQEVPIFKGPQPVTQPTLLDGKGRQLLPAADGKKYPRYRVFQDYDYQNLQFLFDM